MGPVKKRGKSIAQEISDPKRIVVLVHGIHTSRTDADRWMNELAAYLQAEMPVPVVQFRYGWTSGASIRIPIIGWFGRRRRTRKFQRFIERLQRESPDAVVDIVAHSFGTWITHYSMSKGKRHTHLGRIAYMAGIVHSGESFSDEAGHFQRVLCLHSSKDRVVRFALGFGRCGVYGFIHADGDRIMNGDMTPYRHGDYLNHGAAWLALRDFVS